MSSNIRISALAKDLGVKAADIIQKCKDEGVPEDKVKSPSSTVSAGLELSIREWFAASGGGGTAVEVKEHPDVIKMRQDAAPKKKAGAKKGDAEHDGSSGTTVAEAPEQVMDRAGKVSSDGEGSVLNGAEPPHSGQLARASDSTQVAQVTTVASAPEAPIVIRSPRPTRFIPQTSERSATAGPANLASSDAAAQASAPGAARLGSLVSRPTAPPMPTGPLAPTRPGSRTGGSGGGAAPANPSQPATGSPTGVGSGGAGTQTPQAAAGGAGTAQGATGGASGTSVLGPSGSGQSGAPSSRPLPTNRSGTFTPAPMNVPTRPTVVKPVGQVLTEKAKIELKGPKVVRIEAAEQLDNRPRGPRPGGAGGAGMRTGSSGARTGAGAGAGAAGDANSRRNNRRKVGPAGAAPAVPAKRKFRENADDLATPSGLGITEADLAAREDAVARSAGYLKQKRREAKLREESRTGGDDFGRRETRFEISEPFTIRDLSEVTGVKAADIIKKLFMQGVMATVNSGIDNAKAQEIMIDYDIELVVKEAKTAEQEMTDEFASRERTDERPRPPVVTIMGHVDHGKTSLLDAIRNANVAAGEAGGITQKTSAFKVQVAVGSENKTVVFIDTPGHEAFTEMRSRGANVTDVVVLVVGAPEGVMPQTVESINHAKAAGAQIVVALNKCDSPQATEGQINKVMSQLAEKDLNPVAWGGQTEIIKTSATKKTGITELLEILDLQTQVLDLKADFAGPARGRVIEASLNEGRGSVATILVQEGVLKVGDFIVAGPAFGRVRDMTDDKSVRIKEAGPSTPVQISGINEVPLAGDAFFVTDSLKKAEEAAAQRRARDREAALHQPKVTLDSLFSQMKDSEVKEILVVLKADVQGSVDAISQQIEKLSTDEVKVRVLHKAVGGINESDVTLSEASKAVIVGFNVIPSGKARSLAENKSVEIRTYQVIYDILDDVKKAASGMLEPEIRQEIIGHAEVRKVFNVTRVGAIAGCYVTDGSVQRDALIRVTRNGVVIVNDRVLEQLKRVKDDAKEVKANTECGMKIAGYDDIKEGDVLECYKKVEIKRTL